MGSLSRVNARFGRIQRETNGLRFRSLFVIVNCARRRARSERACITALELISPRASRALARHSPSRSDTEPDRPNMQSATRTQNTDSAHRSAPKRARRSPSPGDAGRTFLRKTATLRRCASRRAECALLHARTSAPQAFPERGTRAILISRKSPHALPTSRRMNHSSSARKVRGLIDKNAALATLESWHESVCFGSLCTSGDSSMIRCRGRA